MCSLLLSLVNMLATTCMYLQVMVIHQLPEGSQIMMVSLLWWGEAGKCLYDVAQWLTAAIKEWKNLHSIPSCPPQIPHRGDTEKKNKKHEENIKCKA